eukprot:1159094-Pelagomonas_calceolata.AAC.15
MEGMSVAISDIAGTGSVHQGVAITGSQGGGCADGAKDAQYGLPTAGCAGGSISEEHLGWVPDLGNDAWQDLDLLR